MPVHRLAPARLAVPMVALFVGGLVAGCAPVDPGAVAAVVGTPAARAGAAAVPSASRRTAPSATATPIPSLMVAPIAPSVIPSPTATPIPTLVATSTMTATGPFEVNLYGKGDFVSQATSKQCVPAAMQIMLNIVRPKNDRTKATQASLARLAKRLSDARDHGTEPLGWARGLERRGAGAYAVAVEPTLGKAVRRAVEALRATGRPVGLLVWRGAHSWVRHGFSATADPALSDDYGITGLWVSDPWYPRVSSIWGASRTPDQRITVKQLREDYLKWRRPSGRYPGMDGEYVLVLPVADAAA